MRHCFKFYGGVEGSFVLPRLRKDPSYGHLKNGDEADIVTTFKKMDPLSHQSFASRIFGNECFPNGYGSSLEDLLVDENGAIVSVPGHSFYMRRQGDQNVVYDLAMGFVGNLSDYTNFLRLNNLPPILMRYTKVTDYDPVRTEFFRNIRSLYNEPNVVANAAKNFCALTNDDRWQSEIYSCWNKSLAELASGLESKFEYVDLSDIFSAKRNLSASDIKNTLENVDNGFIVFNVHSASFDTYSLEIVFKSGENVFLADGLKPSAFKFADIDKFVVDMPGRSLHCLSTAQKLPELPCI